MSNIRNRSSRNGSNHSNGRMRTGGGRHGVDRRNNHSNGIVSLAGAKSNYDKYVEKAKDAKSSGDRISAENFLQYADHYKRLLIEADEKKESQLNKDEAANKTVNISANSQQEIDNKEKASVIAQAVNSKIPKEFSL